MRIATPLFSALLSSGEPTMHEYNTETLALTINLPVQELAPCLDKSRVKQCPTRGF